MTPDESHAMCEDECERLAIRLAEAEELVRWLAQTVRACSVGKTAKEMFGETVEVRFLVALERICATEGEGTP